MFKTTLKKHIIFITEKEDYLSKNMINLAITTIISIILHKDAFSMLKILAYYYTDIILW